MMRRFLSICCFFLLLCFFQVAKPITVYANHKCCCSSCSIHVNKCSNDGCACTSTNNVDPDKTHFTNEFIFHRKWLVQAVWEQHMLPAMLLMTEQMTTMAVTQTFSIGTLFDAKHQLESQRLLQTMQAQTHKDYQPSEGVCTFGTNTRALAASDQKANTVNIALSTQAMARQLLIGDTVSANGSSSDRESRWANFKETYCNPADGNNGFDALCASSDPARYNNDIDFSKTISRPYTLELDFVNSNATPHEEDVLALQSNLYGHRITPNFSDNYFMATQSGEVIDKGSFLYLDARALATKRQVAMASYNALAAMKAKGENNVQPYMKAIFEEMGMEANEAQELLGTHPSYYAQMELLTKKLYQNPNFYAELYDKPTNVDRKNVAMQAIGLMQKRDSYNSLLRSEMAQSIWLETALDKLQSQENNFNGSSPETSVIREVMEALQ